MGVTSGTFSSSGGIPSSPSSTGILTLVSTSTSIEKKLNKFILDKKIHIKHGLKIKSII